jgi:hypothetical protein
MAKLQGVSEVSLKKKLWKVLFVNYLKRLICNIAGGTDGLMVDFKRLCKNCVLLVLQETLLNS